jgi:hypothetical protein
MEAPSAHGASHMHKKNNTKKGPLGLFFTPKLFFFVQNFITLGHNPSGRKVCGMEKKKEKKNNTKYNGHFIPQQRPRAAHALRSDQKFCSGIMQLFQKHMLMVTGVLAPVSEHTRNLATPPPPLS